MNAIDLRKQLYGNSVALLLHLNFCRIILFTRGMYILICII